jgi:hypothetical protein
VFVFGAVYIEAMPESYLRLAADINALRKQPNYLAIQSFSDPPQPADLENFTLDQQDIRALKNCKPGSDSRKPKTRRRVHARSARAQ